MLPPYGLVARGFGFALALLAAPLVSAQSQGLVVRDGSLGSGPLEVGPGSDPLGRPATYLITPELGEQRGGNLFHSFARFGVGSGETATFTGPDPIDGPQSVSHVIGRVTGGTPSDIDGTLRSTIPGADLWLFNPSGVIFGEGAQLDVRGSVHVSTGDHLGFAGTGERLHADRSRPSVLSTAPPEAFGFLGESGAAALSLEPGASLSVGAGEALELIAGDVSLTDARIAAPGAHLRLEAQGTVGLERSTVDVSGSEPGTVSIRAGRLVVRGGADVLDDLQRSRVLAENTSTTPGEPGVLGPGAISVDASESILVDNGLLSVNTTGAGNAGTVSLRSPSITLQRGPGYDAPVWTPQATDVGVGAETSGAGTAGRIRIDAHDLVIRDGAAVIAGSVDAGLEIARGNAGSIEIDAHSLELGERSGIGVGAWNGPVEPGTIRIDLGIDGHLVIDAKAQVDVETAYSFITGGFAHSPGVIDIRSGTIELLNGGGIDNICSEACTSKREDRPTDTGMIHIAARELIVRDGWINSSNWDGAGDAGNITIVAADSVAIESSGVLSTQTGGSGKAGNVTIDAGSLHIRGDPNLPRDPGSRPPTGITAGSWPPGASGDSGRIVIRAGDFALEVYGQISANSQGSGKAGTIEVIATDSISLSNLGGDPISIAKALAGKIVLSGIFSATLGVGGTPGSILLDAPQITVSHGALVATTTAGGGPGGKLDLIADRITISDGGVVDSSSLFNVEPGGDGGTVTLKAHERIEIVGRDPEYGAVSRVSSASTGSGKGGKLVLDAPDIVIHGGTVTTHATASISGAEGAGGGDIEIQTGELLVSGGGQVNASTFTSAAAGKIDVLAGESIQVTGEGSAIESRTGAAGAGGDVSLIAPLITIADGGEVSARSQRGIGGLVYLEERVADGTIVLPGINVVPRGNAGNISLSASSAVRLERGVIATSAEAANGGNVTIRAKRLLDLDHGMITASVTGGIGGNIAIDPDAVILRNGSRIEASAGEGAGGRIEISARSFFAFPGSGLSAEAGNPELSGTVEIHSPDVNLAGTLTALPISLLDAPSLLRERCAARTNGERAGSFVVRGPGGIPAEPDGWLRASLPTEPLGTTGPLAQLASPGPFLAPASCR